MLTNSLTTTSLIHPDTAHHKHQSSTCRLLACDPLATILPAIQALQIRVRKIRLAMSAPETGKAVTRDPAAPAPAPVARPGDDLAEAATAAEEHKQIDAQQQTLPPPPPLPMQV